MERLPGEINHRNNSIAVAYIQYYPQPRGQKPPVADHYLSSQLQLNLALRGNTAPSQSQITTLLWLFLEHHPPSLAMSPAAEADPSSLKDSHNTQLEDHKPATSDPIHNDDSPAQTTMNEHDNHNTTETEKDDAATMAASEELKHTTISDKDSNTSTLEPRAPRLELATENKNMEEKVKESTPEHETTEAQDEELKEKLSSPKKKRGRDTYDESKELEGGNADEAGASADGVAVNGSRTEREGPEKKRHRDTSEDPSKVAEKSIEANV